jgi:Metallo-beta-lactamase superfamily
VNDANEEAAPTFLVPMFEGAKRVPRPYIASGQFQPFEDGADLAPGIRAIATPGHSPGHSSYMVESRGQKLLVWGDIVQVAPIQFPDPGVTTTYDSDPGSAERQRDAMFADAAQEGYCGWRRAYHFPGPWPCQRQRRSFHLDSQRVHDGSRRPVHSRGRPGTSAEAHVGLLSPNNAASIIEEAAAEIAAD